MINFVTLCYQLMWLEFCVATRQTFAVTAGGLFAMPMVVEDAVARHYGFQYVYGV